VRTEIKEAEYGDILSVAARMRESDRREIFAMMWDRDGAEQIADNAYYLSRHRWVAYWNTKPAAALGIMQMWPRVWQVWMFGTDDFPRVAGRLIAHCRPRILQTLSDLDALRVEAKSMADHKEAHRFLRRVGGHHEATLRNYGKNGEDFHVYVMLPPFM
jgi:hypothetical protein